VRDVIDTPYIKDRFQEKYFVIDSFEQLYASWANSNASSAKKCRREGDRKGRKEDGSGPRTVILIRWCNDRTH
jgi:phenylalanine-4-hydroxylase